MTERREFLKLLAAEGKTQHVFVLSYGNPHDLWLAHAELKV